MSGNTQSKEEVIIAQTGNGEASTSFTKIEWLSGILIALISLFFIVVGFKIIRKCLKRFVAKEVRQNHIHASRPMLAEETV